MFSNIHNKVREKKFPVHRDQSGKKSKDGFHHTDTVTDNHMLFLAQQMRMHESVHEPVSKIRRLFRWR